MRFRGYRFGVAWIAYNDEPAERDAEVIAGYISTLLLADLCSKTGDEVARDILRLREKEGI